MAVKSSSSRITQSKKKAPLAAVATKTDGGADLDRLIHERTRLAIVSALAVNKKLSFTDIKEILKVSDGNLSTHARKLEDAGYIICKKEFDGRLPRTQYTLSASGRKALKKYISHMESLISAMKDI